jgi:hypothetical protein
MAKQNKQYFESAVSGFLTYCLIDNNKKCNKEIQHKKTGTPYGDPALIKKPLTIKPYPMKNQI